MIAYRLPPEAAQRRALAATGVRAVTSLLPVVLAVVLLRRMGWAPTVMFWVIVAALVALVGVRALVGYGAMLRKLAAMRVTVDEGAAIRFDGARDGWQIEAGNVARIVEVTGSLGGLRVESRPDPRSGMVFVVDVPRGGPGWAEVRAAVESLGPIERRGRRGPAVRFAMGALLVVSIFFLPFILDDFVSHSKLVAASLVAIAWLAMRFALRSR